MKKYVLSALLVILVSGFAMASTSARHPVKHRHHLHHHHPVKHHPHPHH